MNRRPANWGAALGAAVLLSACGTPRINADGAAVREQAVDNVTKTRQGHLEATSTTPGTNAYADARASDARNTVVVRRASRPWIGAKMTAVQSDEVLPPIFSETFNLQFDDRATAGRVKLEVVGERLSRLTKVPVRIKQDVYEPLRKGTGSSGSGSSAAGTSGGRTATNQVARPLPLPTPGALQSIPAGFVPDADNVAAAVMSTQAAQAPEPYSQPVTDLASVEMRWSGTLSGFLDNLTARLNLSWAYRDGSIVIERYQTESFELAAFVDAMDYRMTLGGSSSGSSGASGGSGGASGSASSNINVAESGKVAALESLRKSIDAMVAPSGGTVVLSEGTGRLTVTAPRDVMSRVRDVVRYEDAVMSRQAQIQFDIYSVTTSDNDEKGVDWSLVIQNAAKTWGATVTAPTSLASAQAGGVAYSILSAASGTTATNTQARFGGSSVMLKLLTEISDSATYRPVSLIAMNRQWARQTSLQSTGYLSETTPASSSLTGTSVPGLKTSTVVTGDRFMVQPAILDNGVIMLKFGVSLTELLGLFNVTSGSGSSQQTVQTPETAGNDSQSNIRLRPGEVMVVSGLSRRVASSDTRTLGNGVPIAAGGSATKGYKRQEFLILVRAVQI